MQLYDAESKLKWEYLSQVEKLGEEVKELREQLKILTRQQYFIQHRSQLDEESSDLKRIRKVYNNN